MDIKSIIQTATGKNVVEISAYTDLWKQWYQGDVKVFHNYQIYNGKQKINAKRKTLNMAKKICEDWANLLLNEKTDVTIEGEKQSENLQKLLNDVKFWAKGNEGIEKTFALGNGAFVMSYDDFKKPHLQFVNGGKIYPITIEEDKLTECAFVNINTDTIVVQIHLKDEQGKYYIRTLLGEKEDKEFTMHFGEIDKDFIVETGSDIPWFQMVKPNIANNIDINNPMGISIFANALDNLEGVDLAYDGFCTEMQLGKARIFVDKRTTVYSGEGETPVFDVNDIGFYFLGDGQDESKDPVKFYNPTLRTESFFNGINNALNLLSSKVGFGSNHYRFDQNGISTATQVISENSEMFRTLKKHEIILNDVIIGVCRALMYIANEFCEGYYKFDLNANLEVKFDDSIIEDKEAEKLNDRQDVNLGVMDLAEYRAKWFNEDLETARANIEAISKTKSSVQNWFSGGE